MSETATRAGFVAVNGEYHPVGDADCRVCCSDVAPKPCEEDGCNGIVHAAVTDEWWTDDDYGWIHEYRCDLCGCTDPIF